MSDEDSDVLCPTTVKRILQQLLASLACRRHSVESRLNLLLGNVPSKSFAAEKPYVSPLLVSCINEWLIIGREVLC
jgi:hypothetical protein